MPFIFQIRPAAAKPGFEMSCEGILPDYVHHRRLMDAIVQAVQLGRGTGGDIQIFDSTGKVADVLPVPASDPAKASSC
jgi:hypothetical protein